MRYDSLFLFLLPTMILFQTADKKFLWDESLECYEVRDSDGDYVFLDDEEMEAILKAYNQYKKDNGKD